jgi:hypothetical protein
MVPLMFILVAPVIVAESIVGEVSTALASVLFVKVAGAASVTTVPLAGKVAVDITPIPPRD